MNGPAAIRGIRQYEALGRRERRALDGARQVVAYDRDTGVGIYQSIRDLRSKGVHSSVGSVRRYFGSAIRTDWRGRIVAMDSDPNLRVMNVLTTAGMREVFVHGSKNASIVAAHESAIRSSLLGDQSKLRAWRDAHSDKSFRGTDGALYVPETDPDVIDERDERGEISYEDIYPEVV